RSVAAVREMKRSVERVEDVRLMVETAWSPAAAAEAAWEVERAWEAVVALEEARAVGPISKKADAALAAQDRIFPATCQLWLDAAEVNE
ncbi:MAG: hypothetical protein ACRD98_00270, partial [Nitrososphaera sp.]